MSITAPACASCVLGATSTSLLSFTYHKIETITVNVVPHITIYTSGTSTSRTTNYVSITATQTDYVGGGAIVMRPKLSLKQTSLLGRLEMRRSHIQQHMCNTAALQGQQYLAMYSVRLEPKLRD